MSSAQALFNTTQALYKHLEKLPSDSNREDYLASLQELLDERLAIIEAMPQDADLKAFDRAESMLEMSKTIEHQMQNLMNAIQRDISLVKKKRQTSVKYVNPYQNISRDGMFFDKRK